MSLLPKPAENDELQILFAQQQIEIKGEIWTLKEFTLIQQLQHRAKLTPFITALQTLLNDGNELSLERLTDCIAAHHKDVLFLVALSADKPLNEVQQLTGEDAESVLFIWWAVNADFFTRQAARPLIEKLMQAQQQRLTGAPSLND